MWCVALRLHAVLPFLAPHWVLSEPANNEAKECQTNSPGLWLDYPLVVGELAYMPIAITQFYTSVVMGGYPAKVT